MADAAQAQLQIAVGLFDAASLAAQMPRAPVHFAEAVQDGAANAELGVGFQLHVLAGIEFLHGVDQADNAGVNQIFERNMRGQPVMDAPGDIAHLRKVFEQQALALLADLLVAVGTSVCAS